MLAKLTSKNQLTLPKAAISAVGASDYFEVEVRQGQIVLTPVVIQREDAIRAKLDELGITQQDIADAVEWARSTARHAVAEPQPAYRPARAPLPRKAAPAKNVRRK